MQEQKYQAVMAVLADGASVSEVAQRVGCLAAVGPCVAASLRGRGLAGLASLESAGVVSAPDGGCGGSADAGDAASASGVGSAADLVRTRQLSGRDLGEEVVPSRSAIYRCLVRAGLIDPQARRRRAEHWKRWERGTAMELWQMDVVGGFLLADGRRAKALTGVDDHSRFCVSAHLMLRETSQRVCDGLALAMRTYGVPEEILTDNGKVFTGRFNKPAGRGPLRPGLPRERHHPPADRAQVADHHRQGRAVPPLHPRRVPHRPGLRLAGRSPGRARRVGQRLQPAAPPFLARDGPTRGKVRDPTDATPPTPRRGHPSRAQRG